MGGFRWSLPAGFPAPKIPADNPMTAAKVELGRHLFYDARLSVNGAQSCASCHEQSKAFTDGKARGVGATGEVHPRGAMSIVNVAYTPVLTWANPNMKRLERQAMVPMFGEHPVELGLSGKENEALAKLKAEPRYQKLFPEAFAGDADPFTIENVTKAIAAFERTLISGDSAYDRYLNGDRRAISLSAKRGEALFFSERLECFHCHGGFNFSQTTDHIGKAFSEIEFHNTGLYNLDSVAGGGAYPKDNQGIFEFTNTPEDMGKFRAPTLRNIAVTAPYMHDGSIATLEEVIDHYAAGGRTIADGANKGVGSANPHKSAFVKGFTLTAQEKRDLIAFLRSLTDEKFLRDPRFGNPWSQQRAAAPVERRPFRGRIKWIDADLLGVTVKHDLSRAGQLPRLDAVFARRQTFHYGLRRTRRKTTVKQSLALAPALAPALMDEEKIAMKNHSRLLKLFALALLASGFAALNDLPDVSARDGHKKGHGEKTAIAQSRPASGPTLMMKAVSSPAATGSSQPRLTVTPDGRALLSWLEPAGAKGRALKFAVQEKSGWSAPRTIASGRPFVTHDSMQPVVTLLGDKSLVAYWTENRQLRANDPAKMTWDAEDIYLSSSRDGGKTWTKPAVLHRDMSDCEHSFISVAPAPDNQVAAVWLDGRDKTYAVQHAITKAGAAPGEEIALDTDVCTCCPTAMARTAEGLIVAYRDHTGETRDISYVRFAQGRWSEPQPLHPDGWKIDGCPVNGVDLDADGRRVAAAWFTAAGGPEVKIAFSTDAGASFSAPVRADEGRPIGRAAVALMPGGAIVAWIEKGDKQSRLLARYVGADGKLGPPVMITQSTKSYPRLARVGAQAMLAWTAAGSARTALLTTGNHLAVR